MIFENIIGNEKVKEILTKSINTNSILHSYLFMGIDGIGKSLFAKEFAKAILCLEEKYCNRCKSCLEFENNNHPDYKEINPDGNSIKIEQIRLLTEKIAEKPIVSKYKVYVINNADSMTIEAENCLLKTLEEPPEYAVIILIASNESKLLNTIKSRCTKINFSKIDDKKIKEYIEKNITNKISDNMLKISEGSIGKAYKIVESSEICEKLENLVQNIDKKNLLEIMQEAQNFSLLKDNIKDILDYLNIILYNTKDMKKINCIKIVEEAKKRLNSSSNFDMTIDYLLIKIWEEVNEKYNRS